MLKDSNNFAQRACRLAGRAKGVTQGRALRSAHHCLGEKISRLLAVVTQSIFAPSAKT